MSLTSLVLGGLATWRVTNILVHENGPFHVFRRARVALGVVYLPDSNDIASYKYELTICVWCMSVWVGLLATLLMLAMPSVAPWAFLPFAFSAVTVLLHRATQ